MRWLGRILCISHLNIALLSFQNDICQFYNPYHHDVPSCIPELGISSLDLGISVAAESPGSIPSTPFTRRNDSFLHHIKWVWTLADTEEMFIASEDLENSKAVE